MNFPELPEHKLSIVIPIYNEEECVSTLMTRIHECLSNYPWPWELIMIDDGSSDDTVIALYDAQTKWGKHIHIIELSRNFKQTAAMQAGIDAAAGDVIVTMDGDLQNDPVDIPLLVNKLLNEKFDLVSGWRKVRHDNLWMRRIPSIIANKLISKVTGVNLHDYGCSLKAFRTVIIKRIRLYGEMHRFIPALLSTVTSSRRIVELPVTHHSRQFGKSKYGISRTFRVILDLISVYFFLRFRDRPGHFFGGAGLIISGFGMLILTYLFIIKLFFNENIGARPLLLLGFFLLLIGIQCILTGVLAEILARIYFNNNSESSYTLKVINKAEAHVWHTLKN